MNDVWNLSTIYAGFEDPRFDADLKTLESKIEAYTRLASGLSGMEPLEGLKQGIALEEEISTLAGKLGLYASLRQSANTRDTDAVSQLGRLMGICSAVAAPEAAFHEWAAQLPDLMALIETDAILKEYRFLFSKMQESSRYLLGSRGEEIMARMQLSGGNAWSDLQSYLTSTVPVAYRGGTINLSSVRNLAYDPDPQVRKDAYEAEIACYDRIQDSVAFALNAIKLETISDCKLRGYESPLMRTLKHSDMQKETLDAMLAAMDEYLPKFWQYLKAKARALGHETGLPWYDLFAPMGASATKFTAESTKEYLVEQFSGFDRELADMVARAFDQEWIDFYPRDGKTGGAFCAEVH